MHIRYHPSSAFAIDNVKVSGDAKLYYSTNDVETIYFDGLTGILYCDDFRRDINSTASFTLYVRATITGSYYWSTSFTLNDTATKSIIGKYGYNVLSVADEPNGITKPYLITGTYVIFDQINITKPILGCYWI